MPLDLAPRNGAGRDDLLCAFHGDACQMGARWPLSQQVVELHDLFRNARIAVGKPVEEPDPFTLDKHRPWTKRERRDADDLLARLKEQNARIEEQIRTGRADQDGPP